MAIESQIKGMIQKTTGGINPATLSDWGRADLAKYKSYTTEKYMSAAMNLFNKPSFVSNLYRKNMSQISEKFQEAQNNLNTYFTQAEGNINNSFNRGIDALNQNYSQAIQGVKDIAEPFRESSLMAQTEYRNMLGLGDKTAEQIQADLESTPGYQFRLQQGQQALERSQAAQGYTASGRAMQELTQYGQGMAQGAFQDRMNNILGLMNATSPILAQLTGQQAQLQAGQGQALLGAESQRGLALGDVAMQRGSQLAGLQTQQAGLQSQQAQFQAGLLEQARQADNAQFSARLGAQTSKEATLGAAQIGAMASASSAVASAAAQSERTQSQERLGLKQIEAGLLSGGNK